MLTKNLQVIDAPYTAENSYLFGDDWKAEDVEHCRLHTWELSNDMELKIELSKAREVIKIIETGNNGGRYDYDFCLTDKCWGSNSNTLQGAIHNAMGHKLIIPKGFSLPGINGKFYNGLLDDLLQKMGAELQKEQP
ncbi:hypothetical protein NF27_AB00010 [Candidatus Jidaibacter acanthamoeba]|uniref:Uncharacterized protein n=2 Tax=Candidatus Jidaibacter acanthamoebae TaxID=86105 RepID=A0A0C1R211_9RICK|nr:hypothetical protein NF27_AB00010 [Candidatus Jidaibacter acanthamoeba]